MYKSNSGSGLKLELLLYLIKYIVVRKEVLFLSVVNKLKSEIEKKIPNRIYIF